MRRGGRGPFGVAALIVTIGVQALAFGALGAGGAWIAVAVAVATGRVSAVFACRRGIPASSPSGFGALVADSQTGVDGRGVGRSGSGRGAVGRPDRWWQGPLVIVVALPGRYCWFGTVSAASRASTAMCSGLRSSSRSPRRP